MEINVNEFKNLLKTNFVEFVYEKKNGEKRKAIGTMQKTILESVLTESKKDKDADDKKKRKMPETSVFYYDCEKKAFRSFVASKLLSYKVCEQ